jgi:glycosyltransferase involved in cell wall biosynthesis
MRILWMSNAPWSSSGYGQQTALFLPRLKNLGHEMGCFAYYGLEGGGLNLNGVAYYPRMGHPYGNDVSVAHYQMHRAELMISLMDVWVMNPEDYDKNITWVPWYPVDHDPMPSIIRGKLAHAMKRITYSKFGVEKTHEAGLDCYYIPHGIDTAIFYPGDKQMSRANLGWPNDKWIVSTVAMNKGNPSRKNFAEMAMAFAEFHKKHPDTTWFIQALRGDSSNDMINIPELMSTFGLIEGQDWVMPAQYQTAVGFPAQYIADVYRASDCMMLVSAGEGFGIPLLEAQAVGCPIITSGWTANKELCFAGRLIDKKDAYPFYTSLASYQFKPRWEAITDALNQEYETPTGIKEMHQAVKTVKDEYDVDVITATKWKPILAEIKEARDEFWRSQGWPL